ncbi:hypothetical protein E2F50_05950 [Rhizobium deserti]|uniref:Uncharacterized protein n=1 Tax=Rhizobium deserti TaxID=2547961 RepID=A0A4R5UNZ8_9HYPH|nr:hypothetical protein E2F50_05950 [Rhizobium deserti]
MAQNVATQQNFVSENLQWHHDTSWPNRVLFSTKLMEAGFQGLRHMFYAALQQNEWAMNFSV